MAIRLYYSVIIINKFLLIRYNKTATSNLKKEINILD